MSDTYTPKRSYTRRADSEAAHQGAQDAQEDTQAAEPSRRRKRASVGGYTQRLTAEPRPGYVRRWVNDDGSGRVERLNADYAYDFVQDPSVNGDELGSRVARYVGRKPTGEPMRAYLMETPQAEYDVGVAEKEDRLKPFEEAIRSGKDTTGELKEAETYRPRAGSSLKRS